MCNVRHFAHRQCRQTAAVVEVPTAGGCCTDRTAFRAANGPRKARLGLSAQPLVVNVRGLNSSFLRPGDRRNVGKDRHSAGRGNAHQNENGLACALTDCQDIDSCWRGSLIGAKQLWGCFFSDCGGQGEGGPRKPFLSIHCFVIADYLALHSSRTSNHLGTFHFVQHTRPPFLRWHLCYQCSLLIREPVHVLNGDLILGQ
jgi:hypothetical protein